MNKLRKVSVLEKRGCKRCVGKISYLFKGDLFQFLDDESVYMCLTVQFHGAKWALLSNGTQGTSPLDTRITLLPRSAQIIVAAN